MVSRFRGEPVPATGFSIGVSRLQAALTMLDKIDTTPEFGPVVVVVMDRNEIAGHVDAAYSVSLDRLDVVVAGGPAFFTVSQDLAESVGICRAP